MKPAPEPITGWWDDIPEEEWDDYADDWDDWDDDGPDPHEWTEWEVLMDTYSDDAEYRRDYRYDPDDVDSVWTYGGPGTTWQPRERDRGSR